MVNLEDVRRDFPMLNKRRSRDGKPLVYLDNAATTFKPRQVIEAVLSYYENFTANVHRGIYQLSQEVTDLYEDSRERIAKFIGARKSSEIIFTKNSTEAFNIVAYGFDWKPGDEIITTVMEHHSNIVPWQIIRNKFGVKLKFIDLTNDGSHLNLNNLENLLTERTKIVALTHVSNMLGTINPVKEVIRRAHEMGALTLIDAAQSVPHMPINVQELECDLLVFSGHKMLGPTGIGILYMRSGVEEQIQPPFGGGEMIKTVTLEGCTWNDMPWRFEPGTPNVSGAIGLAAAVDYLSKLGMDWVRKHEIELTKLAMKRLSELDKVTVYGPKNVEERGGIISFNVEGVDGHDVALLLDEFENIAVRSGLHCAEPLHRKLGIQSSVRASFYLYNTEDEINLFCDTLEKIVDSLG